MIQRCTNPKNLAFPQYGGRGITVCERWRDFANFLTDMGEKPTPRHSIDRIDGARGYEPGNCRWATSAEQARNKRTNRFVTYRGRTMTVRDWATEYGFCSRTLYQRFSRGWPAERALTEPVHRHNR